jgi:hypothetical protein
MFAIAFLFVRVFCDCFKSRRRLEAEILVLRHQLNVLQQCAPRRLYLTWADRALFVRLYRGFPRILDAIMILRPETIVRWHRAHRRQKRAADTWANKRADYRSVELKCLSSNGALTTTKRTVL